MQLSSEGLLPFNADKQAAFGLAVWNAFKDHTPLYALNVTALAPPPAAARRRCVPPFLAAVRPTGPPHGGPPHHPLRVMCALR
jgi:hypothetical protein